MQKDMLDEHNLLDISKDNQLKNEILDIDVENLTPMQALTMLARLVDIARKD